MTCLKLTGTQKDIMNQTIVIHHYRLVDLNCKPLYTLKINTKSFTVMSHVVLARRRHVKWEAILVLCVVQELFAMFSTL